MPSSEIRFCGTVEGLDVFPKSEGIIAVAVDVDVKYYVAVRTEEAVELDAGLGDKFMHIFGIHSPTRLFHAERKDIIGNRYEFIYAKPQGAKEIGGLQVRDCEKK